VSGVDVLVSGYASIDEAHTATRIAGAAQTGILTGLVRPEARPGGCGPNSARVLAGLGTRVGIVTWVGDDPQGRAFVAGLEEAGVDPTGVAIGPGPSPRSILIYDAAGDAACYFHPSGSAGQRVDPAIQGQLSGATWLAITVGPRELTEQLLDLRRPTTRLAWNVKADPAAFPPALCRRLAVADLICLNRGELAFVADALELPDRDPAQLVERGAGCVVLTRGADGYLVVTADGTVERAVEPIASADPTGAGDAFFAGILAWLARGATPPDAAAEGARAAADYLRGRAHTRAGVPS
jgi:ribokinase